MRFLSRKTTFPEFTRFRRLIRPVVVASGLVTLLAFTSCRDDSPPVVPQNEAVEEDSAAADQCERTLANLLDGLAPGRFGISSDREVLVDTLNNWFAECADPATFTTSDADEERRRSLLPEGVLELTQRDRFSEQDAVYFRNALLLRDLINATLRDERTDRDRIVTLFYKVIEIVDLQDPGSALVPFGPYETALFGRGTAADRAWLFGMLVRQLRLDAVVIRPRSLSADEKDAFLVGVVVPEEGVYLFDFQLGLPLTVPEEGERPLPREPIVLSKAREDDAVFRQYDLRGTPYPLTAEHLQEIDVLAIGESSTWSPRMGLLQSALTEPLEIYDGLSTHSLRGAGLIDRLIAVGAGDGEEALWQEENVGIWDYPDSVYSQATQLSPEQKQQLQAQSMIMEAPWTVRMEEEDGQAKPVLGRPREGLLLARIRHLQGDYETALRVYLNAQLAPTTVMNRPFELNAYAADWSAYWAATAQYDQEDYRIAAESTERYLRRPGTWTNAARVLRAKSLALLPEPRFRDAANLLARELSRSPQRRGNQWLVRYWRRLARTGETDEPQDPAAQPDPMPEENTGTPTDTSVKQTPDDLPAGEESPDSRFEHEDSRTLSEENETARPMPSDAPQSKEESLPVPENSDAVEPSEKP